MKKQLLFLISIAVLLLAINACPNIFNDKPVNKPEVLIPQGYGAVRVSFVQGEARTAMPDAVLSAFRFEYFFSKDGGELVKVSPDDDLFILEPGNYELTVKAFVSEDENSLAAQGNSDSPFEITAGDITPSVTLTLRPFVSGEGTGTLQFGLVYPSGITVDTFTLTRMAGDETFNLMDTDIADITITGTDPVTLDGTLSDIPVGYYLLDVLLRNASSAFTGKTEVVHIYQNLITQTSIAEYTFTDEDFSAIIVTNTNDSGPGSLRQAISAAQDGQFIRVMLSQGSVIELNSRLDINKSLTIRGNGVTITRSDAWTVENDNTQLMSVSGSNTVHISRVHFRGGRAANNGGAINNGATLTLESCIFSANHTTGPSARGGAVFNTGTLTVNGNTFYGNSTFRGGAIYINSGTLSLSGNLFYANTASDANMVVHRTGGTVNSYGNNVVDVDLAESGLTNVTEGLIDDIVISDLPVSPQSFRLLLGSEAANIINALPAQYPRSDFYGDPIADGAAAGAAQAFVSGSGFTLEILINPLQGSVNISPPLDADGLAAGPVSVTAASKDGFAFSHWLVDGDSFDGNPHTLAMSSHTRVQPVYDLIVTNFSDAAGSINIPGTLRYAIANVSAGGTIRFIGVEPGVTTIALTSGLVINRSVNIEGNGITLNRGMSIENSGTIVNISRIHFRNSGPAITNLGGTVNIESSIFSGHTRLGGDGGAIASGNSGNMTIRACTFYNNTARNRGGAISTASGRLTLTGNLFYGNTADSQYPVVYRGGGVVVPSYNAVDVEIGTGTTQSGWAAGTGDTFIGSDLPFSPMSFRPFPNSEAVGIITTLPEDYPAVDFYGNPITDGANAGAVQGTVTESGFILELSVNNAAWGSVAVLPASEDYIFTSPITLTANANPGYGFRYWLQDGVEAGNANPWSLTLSDHTRIQAVFGPVVTNFSDAPGSETIPGTLRFALASAPAGETIRFIGVTPGVSVIELTGRLNVGRSVTIEGNGITLTRSPSWTTVDGSSSLINSDFSGGVVNISRVHFRGGRATTTASAIRLFATSQNPSSLFLESCIFSDNRSTGSQWDSTSVILVSNGDLFVNGCTFYANISGAEIIQSMGSGRVGTLTGNLFYLNTFRFYSMLVTGNITSGGYNVVDVPLGTASNQSGWTAITGDKTISTLPVSPASFRLIAGGGAENVITTLPADYPTVDFYGDPITNGAAAGAVQSIQSGFYIYSSVSDPARGSISVSPSFQNNLVPSGIPITVTASPAAGYELIHWLQDGVNVGNDNPRTLTLEKDTEVHALFGLIVNDFSGSAAGPGTFRFAINNAQTGETIQFRNVTPGVTTIQLTSPLPAITRSITIEGNGIVLTRSSGMAQNATSQLLTIDSAPGTVTISRVWFRDGRATNNGAAIRKLGGSLSNPNNWPLILESCIFSGNQTPNHDLNNLGLGGAIFGGNIFARGCTFYSNVAGLGSAMINRVGGDITLTANLFFGNTAIARMVDGHAYWNEHGTYNVADVTYGYNPDQTGWYAGPGDTTYSALGITGDPINTSTMAPINSALNFVPEDLADFPATDFYGNARTWPGAPGAVR